MVIIRTRWETSFVTIGNIPAHPPKKRVEEAVYARLSCILGLKNEDIAYPHIGRKL